MTPSRRHGPLLGDRAFDRADQAARNGYGALAFVAPPAPNERTVPGARREPGLLRCSDLDPSSPPPR
jgi:hypothetical protein